MVLRGRARQSLRAVLCQPDDGAQGLTRPTSRSNKLILMQALCLDHGKAGEVSSFPDSLEFGRIALHQNICVSKPMGSISNIPP